MAGVPAGFPAGVRIGDHISLGVIARAFPPDPAQIASRCRWVQRALAETHKASERDLPAQVKVYYANAMALYMRSSTREVLRWRWQRPSTRFTGRRP